MKRAHEEPIEKAATLLSKQPKLLNVRFSSLKSAAERTIHSVAKGHLKYRMIGGRNFNAMLMTKSLPIPQEHKNKPAWKNDSSGQYSLMTRLGQHMLCKYHKNDTEEIGLIDYTALKRAEAVNSVSDLVFDKKNYSVATTFINDLPPEFDLSREEKYELYDHFLRGKKVEGSKLNIVVDRIKSIAGSDESLSDPAFLDEIVRSISTGKIKKYFNERKCSDEEVKYTPQLRNMLHYNDNFNILCKPMSEQITDMAHTKLLKKAVAKKYTFMEYAEAAETLKVGGIKARDSGYSYGEQFYKTTKSIATKGKMVWSWGEIQQLSHSKVYQGSVAVSGRRKSKRLTFIFSGYAQLMIRIYQLGVAIVTVNDDLLVNMSLSATKDKHIIFCAKIISLLGLMRIPSDYKCTDDPTKPFWELDAIISGRLTVKLHRLTAPPKGGVEPPELSVEGPNVSISNEGLKMRRITNGRVLTHPCTLEFPIDNIHLINYGFVLYRTGETVLLQNCVEVLNFMFYEDTKRLRINHQEPSGDSHDKAINIITLIVKSGISHIFWDKVGEREFNSKMFETMGKCVNSTPFQRALAQNVLRICREKGDFSEKHMYALGPFAAGDVVTEIDNHSRRDFELGTAKYFYEVIEEDGVETILTDTARAGDEILLGNKYLKMPDRDLRLEVKNSINIGIRRHVEENDFFISFGSELDKELNFSRTPLMNPVKASKRERFLDDVSGLRKAERRRMRNILFDGDDDDDDDEEGEIE